MSFYRLIACIAWAIFMPACGLLAQDDSSEVHLEIREHVHKLIEQLGDPSYATRRRARGELERLGLIAFDSLHEAQQHENREIAMVARHMVESLHVSWSVDSDSEEVKHILDKYGDISEVERKSRMDRLAALPKRDGLAALCRLVRFETKLRLSRAAALLIMQQKPEASIAQRRRNGNLVLESLGSNNREGTKWLKLYVQDLMDDGFNGKQWKELIQVERDRVEGHTTRQTDELTVLELYRICAVRAKELGRRDEAIEFAFASLDLVEGRRQPLRNATTWALDHAMWEVVLRLYDRDAVDFKKDASLLYAVAEALTETGKPEEGSALVVDALELAPIDPLNEDGTSPMGADALEQAARWHTEVAKNLTMRGRFEWAEREYRYVIDRSPLDSAEAASARMTLAFMLGDLDENAEAADVLRPVVERMKKDGDLRRQATRISQTQALKRCESRMHLYDARVKIAQKDFEGARESLRQSLKADDNDGDVLIEMFRLDGDDDWKREARIAIRNSATEFEKQIRSYERIMKAGGGVPRANFGTVIAYHCNQYAWLVCNTEGDFQKALAYSKRSLELEPKDASKTDTLAHCYYAVGDIDAAVRTQREAHGLEPHSRPIKRQLEFFISKQAAAQREISK